MGNQLKPCPFCKSEMILQGKAILHTLYNYWIGCDSCPCNMYGDDLDKLIKAWNTRPEARLDYDKLLNFLKDYRIQYDLDPSDIAKSICDNQENLT